MSISNTLWIYLITIGVSLLVALVIRLLTWATAHGVRTKSTVVSASESGNATASEPENMIELEVIAAISGAIHHILGAHRIVHISTHHRSDWVSEARQIHHHSHSPLQHHTKH